MTTDQFDRIVITGMGDTDSKIILYPESPEILRFTFSKDGKEVFYFTNSISLILDIINSENFNGTITDAKTLEQISFENIITNGL